MIYEITDKDYAIKLLNSMDEGFPVLEPLYSYIYKVITEQVSMIAWSESGEIIGFLLYQMKKEVIWIDLIWCLNKVRPEMFEALEKYFNNSGGRCFMFQTQRPKAWPRFWPGCEPVYTVMRKELEI